MKKKRKISVFIWPIIYFVLVINVCISALMVFHSFYYRSIFVSGSSMEPTLSGNTANYVDYGIIDDHAYAIDHLTRFKIITTYYPWVNVDGTSDYIGGFVKGSDKNVIDEKNASYKIKRVYAFPGEYFKFEVDPNLKAEIDKLSDTTTLFAQQLAQKAIHFYVKTSLEADWGKPIEITFKRKINIATMAKYNYVHKDSSGNIAPLGEGEYWVMGDNYSASSDCFSKNQPVYRANLVGVLVAIEGTCKIHNKVDSSDDGTKISYSCVDRKKHWPIFF